ncbi:MAG: NAD(P)-dependent oxidoreductase [Chloroflexota bacterium]|nr:NAD(P)-dependent oxidoreductase [Chloroflexota bacterium]
MRVAVVGTGRMGSAMARAIARGDGELLLYNRTPDRAKPLADELGATLVDSPADAASTADVCITMLADGAAVASVWDGDDGLVSNVRAGAVLVDMSTVPPDTLQPYATRVRERGAGLLDAPVSGSTQLAESGSLTIMAGGEAEDLERARPVLDRLARTVHHVGPLGSGSAMKLAVNAVIFALNNAVSEALVIAERAGIDRALAYEIIATSAAGAPFVGYKREAFVEPETAPIGFSLDLASKDLALITAFADRLGVPVAQAAANATLIGQAAERVGADRDFAQVAAHLRALAGEGRQG